MKITIRSRIFLPVLLVILVLPLAVCLVFFAVSERFMEQVSQREIELLFENVQPIAETAFRTSNETAEQNPERNHSKIFVNEVKKMLRQTQNDAQLMILTPKLESIYPKNLDSQSGARALYNYLTDSVNTKTWESSDFQRISLDGSNYLICIRQMEQGRDTRAKFLIAYNPLNDTVQLRYSIAGLVFVITAVLAGLSLIVVWKTADSIAKPMNHLCIFASQIGKGNYNAYKDKSNLIEVDELTCAMREMSEQLKHAEDMQKTFLQNASHELRTPLMSISGYAQGMQCGVFADSTEPIDAILSESRRLTNLVGELLCLSRMDSEKESLELRTLNLTEIICGCLEQLGGLALDSGIAFSFPAEDTELIVCADETLFARAFSNIASNAIRYAKSKITIQAKRKEDTVIILVKDDGDGIAPEDQKHIFERFYKGKYGNCGLGLSIAKTSMEYMGGYIHARNGKSGAIFEIVLKS